MTAKARLIWCEQCSQYHCVKLYEDPENPNSFPWWWCSPERQQQTDNLHHLLNLVARTIPAGPSQLKPCTMTAAGTTALSLSAEPPSAYPSPPAPNFSCTIRSSRHCLISRRTKRHPMIAYANFKNLLGDTSPIFSVRRGAELRETSIKSFGITPTVVASDDSYTSSRITPPRDRALLYQWFGWMQIEAVSVEAEDLSILIPDKVCSTMMQTHWDIVGPMLDKRTPDELFDSLESAAVRAFNSKIGPEVYGEMSEQKLNQTTPQPERTSRYERLETSWPERPTRKVG